MCFLLFSSDNDVVSSDNNVSLLFSSGHGSGVRSRSDHEQSRAELLRGIQNLRPGGDIWRVCGEMPADGTKQDCWWPLGTHHPARSPGIDT